MFRVLQSLFERPMPTSEPVLPAASAPAVEPSQQALRNLLARRVQKQPVAAELYYAQSGLVRRWAYLLPKEMAIRVMAADDRAIRRHIGNIERMKRVIPCTLDDVAAHEKANALAARPPIDDRERGGGGGKKLKASAMESSGARSMGRR